MVLFPLPNCKKFYRIPSPASESNFNTKGPWSLVILLCLKTTYHCDFLFITLAMHPLYIYIYIYIRQRPAYPANFPMASNSGYLPLFIRPIVVAVVVVVVVLVSKSHPKPLLGIWIIRLSGQLKNFPSGWPSPTQLTRGRSLHEQEQDERWASKSAKRLWCFKCCSCKNPKMGWSYNGVGRLLQ